MNTNRRDKPQGVNLDVDYDYFFLAELGILILKTNKVSHVVHFISRVC